MAEDLTVPAGLTDYIVILWMNAPLDYGASFPVDFQFLADSHNGILDKFTPFSYVEAIQIKSNADCITEALKSCRYNWNLMETSDLPFPVAMAGNYHILSNRGIRRIKTYISESALPNKSALLNDCKRLEKLRKTFRESPVTDTIAAIVTHHPADEVGENFALPKSPLVGINFLYISAISRDNFRESCGGLNSYLARDVANELRTPRKKKSWVLTNIEGLLERSLAPYLEFGPAAGITPAPDAADATAEETPATGTGETAEAAPVKRRRLPAGFKMIEQGNKPMTDEHIDLFFRKVLKHVVKIGHHTADGKKWEYADKEKTGTNQTRDHESFIFEYNGTRYRVFCYIDTKPEFCVKRQDCTGQGHPHYFHFIG